MSRYAKRGVTKEELERRIADAGGMEEVLWLPKIQSDLKKIEFYSTVWFPEQDYEGFIMPDYEIGFDTLENGVVVFWTAAGDIDAEFPVAFCVYVGNDGSLRAYIPKDGNAYDTKTKSAFGHYGEEEGGVEGDELEEVVLDEYNFDMDLLRKDAGNRILFKS